MTTPVETAAIIVAPDQATVRYSIVESEPVYDYFGMTSPRHFGPEAFMGDLGPKHTTRSHFHPVDSFQVFLGSPGSQFQGAEIPKVLIHYSDAYGVYGPFSSNGANLQCFTLRPESSAFTAYMIDPARREFVPGCRHYDSNVEPLLAEDPPSDSTVAVQTLMAPEDDGLAAYLLTAGPEAEISADLVSSPKSSGSYVYVISGELDWGGTRYGSRSLAWVPPSGDVPPLRGYHGADGPLRLVVMHFPWPLTSSARPFG